jgi:phenylpyruvate tautomerase PptA (4-oxalocrotonate tautomerase family)
MPLIRIDAVEGRSPAEVKTLLDATHRAVLSAFGVPERDRYQIYQEHPSAYMVVEDTGLGIERTDKCVVLSITSMPRDEAKKQKLYAELCREFAKHCDMQASDVVVAITTNSGPDWSFGNGVAQFVTGDL